MDKPSKPYDDFPLFPHGNKCWAKKVDGKLKYFGPWSGGWQAALKKYHAFLNAPKEDLGSVVNQYIESRRLLEQSGDIGKRHLADIQETLGRLVKIGGKPTRLNSVNWGRFRATLADTMGPVSLGGHITRVRAFLNWCLRQGLIPAFPASDHLRKPTRSKLRIERAKRGSKLFSPEEIKLLLPMGGQLRSMILLAINGGLGPTDLAGLNHDHINGEWLNYPRPKTGVMRRIPLWSETLKAIPSGDGLVFRTVRGNAWTSKAKKGSGGPISQKFTKRCQDLDIHKPGRGFYALRHTFATIGGESGDQVATSFIMGHAERADDMASVYRERISDNRLLRVTDYVHEWLFGAKGAPPVEIDPAVSVPVEVQP